MSDQFLACSACHEVVLKGQGASLKVRAKVLIFEGNLAYAVCKGCGAEIPVPLRLDEHMMKSILDSEDEPKLYLCK